MSKTGFIFAKATVKSWGRFYYTVTIDSTAQVTEQFPTGKKLTQWTRTSKLGLSTRPKEGSKVNLLVNKTSEEFEFHSVD